MTSGQKKQLLLTSVEYQIWPVKSGHEETCQIPVCIGKTWHMVVHEKPVHCEHGETRGRVIST